MPEFETKDRTGTGSVSPDPTARVRRFEVIVNARAGTVLGLGEGAVTALIERVFGEGGVETTLCLVPPEGVFRAVEAARARAPDAIVVGGGDGTQRTAAHLLAGSPIPLGILPLGTLNRLARDLGIPIDAEAAARALVHGEERAIDVGEVNGRLFLCNSLMGLPLTYAEERQRLRGKPVVERITGYARVIYRLIRMRHRISLEIDDGETGERLRALTLAVSNNVYAEEPSLTLRRPSLEQGELGVYIARHPTGFALGLALARALLGRWRMDPHLTEKRAHKLVIRTHARRVRLANDGEVEEFSTPLVYRSRSKHLRVLVPRAVETAAKAAPS